MDSNYTTWCNIINQLHALDTRARQSADSDFYRRRIERIHDLLKDIQLLVHDPLGEMYSSTRTDCEAILEGEPGESMKIVEVIKPIIYYSVGETRRLIQPGVVLVKGKAS